MKTKELTEVNNGENIRRFRSLMGIKQDDFADRLTKLTGEKWNQGQVSALESKTTIPHDLLEHAANAIGIPVKLLEIFPENIDKDIINLFMQAVSNNNGTAIGCTHVDITNNNPVEQVVEMATKNAQLYKELLAEKDAKYALLEKVLSERK